MKQRTLIRDLEANQFLEGIFAIHNCQLGQTKAGKPFIKCLLSDRSGRTPGRMWNASEQIFRGLPTDGFVFLEGQTQPYQGEIQIIINSIYAAEPTEADLDWLLPTSAFDLDDMFAQVQATLATLSHPGLKALAGAYLADEPLMTRFRRAPAGITLHHAFIGGLLEHTLNLLKLADLMLPRYPQLNRDIVMLGLFIHDLGKCAELTWDAGFAYTDDGQLVGHIVRGAMWLEQKAAQCAAAGAPVAEPILRVLTHIILSHHGKPEFGAVKLPATPEAIFISLLDNLDAKMQMALAVTRGDGAPEADGEQLGGDFTEKIWALETRLYRPDPTTLPPPEAGSPASSGSAAAPAASPTVRRPAPAPNRRGGLE